MYSLPFKLPFALAIRDAPRCNSNRFETSVDTSEATLKNKSKNLNIQHFSDVQLIIEPLAIVRELRMQA